MVPFLGKVGIVRYSYGTGPTRSYLLFVRDGAGIELGPPVRVKKTNGQTEKFSTHFRLAEISIAGRTISESA